ncbi:SDR family NAD(P)-dependent oxidoreductase [Halalkalirubrum salinum]|uniref:SDR family NAD(P)-dependent oxidoreductase n=1 Tax=Halalkalirubrum salinum TaxID=2563889 RepID=UPI0010FB039E|nr:SDR family NAD(P)-dependent oxidoreductase [Halalkalirubrum salinum]
MTASKAEVGAGVADVALDGQTALVTGATAGIGRETALALSRLGARVFIHGRDRDRGEAVLNELPGDGTFIPADFATQAGVTRLAEDVRAQLEGGTIDILVHNAGGWFTDGQLTGDRIEYTFAVNHLASFRLTYELFEALAPTARIVIVSSEAHRQGSLDFTGLRSVSNYRSWNAYSRSKLANVLFARELADRLDAAGESITANALHPGVIPGSGFGRHALAPLRGLMSAFGSIAAKLPVPGVDSVVEGAETSVYLAASPAVEEVSGKYFKDCAIETPAPQARDDATADRLWQISEELCEIEWPLGVDA